MGKSRVAPLKQISMTILKYIENDAAQYKTFVANRVSFIREASKPSQWLFVGSKENPADHVLRGLMAENLLKCENWIKAPKFLVHCQKMILKLEEML